MTKHCEFDIIILYFRNQLFHRASSDKNTDEMSNNRSCQDQNEYLLGKELEPEFLTRGFYIEAQAGESVDIVVKFVANPPATVRFFVNDI